MWDYFKRNRVVPFYADRNDASKKSLFDEGPIGAFVYHEEKVEISMFRAADDQLAKHFLLARGIPDVFTYIDHQESILEWLDTPVEFVESVTCFLANFICGMANSIEHREHKLQNPFADISMPDHHELKLLDMLEITKMVKEGYQNHGRSEQGFFVPVFTAFPFKQPEIDVGLECTSSVAKTAGFKIKFPSIGGGFSHTMSSSFTMKHQANPDAIQQQQQVVAEMVKWVNRYNGHVVVSVNITGTKHTRIAYDDKTLNSNYIDCHVNVGRRRALVAHQTMSHNHHISGGTPHEVVIKKSNKETLGFTAPLGRLAFSMEVQTETMDEFKVSYALPPGHEYKFWGAKSDTHYLFPEAGPI